MSSHKMLQPVIGPAGIEVRWEVLSSFTRLGNCIPRGAYVPSYNGSYIYTVFILQTTGQTSFVPSPITLSNFNSTAESLPAFIVCVPLLDTVRVLWLV